MHLQSIVPFYYSAVIFKGLNSRRIKLNSYFTKCSNLRRGKVLNSFYTELVLIYDYFCSRAVVWKHENINNGYHRWESSKYQSQIGIWRPFSLSLSRASLTYSILIISTSGYTLFSAQNSSIFSVSFVPPARLPAMHLEPIKINIYMLRILTSLVLGNW